MTIKSLSTYAELTKAFKSAKYEFSRATDRIEEFFENYLLENDILSQYVWEPCIPKEINNVESRLYRIQTKGDKAPYEKVPGLEDSFLTVMSHLSDLRFTFSDKHYDIQLLIDDTHIYLESKTTQYDHLVNSSLLSFINDQKLVVNFEESCNIVNWLEKLNKTFKDKKNYD